MKLNVIKPGTTFQGRMILDRLDSGNKPFREVFLCSREDSGKQILIRYRNRLIPQWMIEPATACPMEYYTRIHMNEKDGQGLPKLLEYGQDSLYTWMFEEYLEDTLSADELLNGLDPSTFVGDNLLESVLDACANALDDCPFLNEFEYGKLVTPDNIRFRRIDKRNLKVFFIGLDGMLATKYPDFRAASEFYDFRYAASDADFGCYGFEASSYSIVLAILSAIAGEFFFQMKRPTPEDDPKDWSYELFMKKPISKKISFPEGYEDVLLQCVTGNPEERAYLPDAISEIDSIKENYTRETERILKNFLDKHKLKPRFINHAPVDNTKVFWIRVNYDQKLKN